MTGKSVSPEKRPDRNFTKMILLSGGGVHKTVQSPGEAVRYGVTYRNTGRKAGAVRITDRIDPRLTDVNPLGGFL